MCSGFSPGSLWVVGGGGRVVVSGADVDVGRDLWLLECLVAGGETG